MAWWLVTLSLALPIYLAAAVLMKRLRTLHPHKYAELGSPSFIPESLSSTPNWAFARFLWLENPRGIGDPQVVVLVWLIRVQTAFFAAWCFGPLFLSRGRS